MPNEKTVLRWISRGFFVVIITSVVLGIAMVLFGFYQTRNYQPFVGELYLPDKRTAEETHFIEYLGRIKLPNSVTEIKASTNINTGYLAEIRYSFIKFDIKATDLSPFAENAHCRPGEKLNKNVFSAPPGSSPPDWWQPQLTDDLYLCHIEPSDHELERVIYIDKGDREKITVFVYYSFVGSSYVNFQATDSD